MSQMHLLPDLKQLISTNAAGGHLRPAPASGPNLLRIAAPLYRRFLAWFHCA